MSDVDVTTTGASVKSHDKHNNDLATIRDADRVSREVLERAAHTDELVWARAAHTNEIVQNDSAALMVDVDKQAAALAVQSAVNAGAATVQLAKVAGDIQVQAQQFANLSSVQATNLANLASVQATTNYNALTLQNQTDASASVLLATQVAAKAAAQLAECCCEMKSNLAASTQRILDDGQKTRDLINAGTQQDLRDALTARNTEIASLYAAQKAPVSPV